MKYTISPLYAIAFRWYCFRMKIRGIPLAMAKKFPNMRSNMKRIIGTIVFYLLMAAIGWCIFNTASVLVARENAKLLGFYTVKGSYPYVVTAGMIACDDEFVCQHEIGHLLDEKYGWPSQSDEFLETIRDFREFCFPEQWFTDAFPDACDWILNDAEANGDDYYEIYADLYSMDKVGWPLPASITLFFSEYWQEIYNVTR